MGQQLAAPGQQTIRFTRLTSRDSVTRIYGVKPPVAGKKGRASHAAASCMGAAKDLVCQHVLAKGPPIAQPGVEPCSGTQQAQHVSRELLTPPTCAGGVLRIRQSVQQCPHHTPPAGWEHWIRVHSQQTCDVCICSGGRRCAWQGAAAGAVRGRACADLLPPPGLVS